MAFNYNDKLRGVIMGTAQNAVQKLTVNMTDLLYRLCVKNQHKVGLIRRALIYYNNASEARRLIARCKLCRFVHDKFYVEAFEAQGLAPLNADINEAQRTQSEIQVTNVERDMLQLCKEYLVDDEELVILEHNMKARIEARAESINQYHNVVAAVKNSEFNTKYMHIKVQREATKAAIGVTPAEFKLQKGLKNSVSARDYMAPSQLQVVSYVLNVSAASANYGENKEQFTQRLAWNCEHQHQAQEYNQELGDHGLSALRSDDARVRQRRVELERMHAANAERRRVLNEREAAAAVEEEEDEEEPEAEAEIDDNNEEEEDEENQVRLITVRNQTYQALVAALGRHLDAWTTLDDIQDMGVQVSLEEADDMYNSAQPCDEDCQGLLIMKDADDSYNIKYVQ